MLSAGFNESKPFAAQEGIAFHPDTHPRAQRLLFQTRKERLRYQEFGGFKEGLIEKPRVAKASGYSIK